jgi:DNA-binding NarL/FixJ family response regulator
MCHGQPVATDNLTDVYSNRPFGKVFKAIREVQEYLQPVFAAAGATPFASRYTKFAFRSPTRNKILQLHDEGLSVRAIADKVGRSRTAVHRHIRRHGSPSIQSAEPGLP